MESAPPIGEKQRLRVADPVGQLITGACFLLWARLKVMLLQGRCGFAFRRCLGNQCLQQDVRDCVEQQSRRHGAQTVEGTLDDRQQLLPPFERWFLTVANMPCLYAANRPSASPVCLIFGRAHAPVTCAQSARRSARGKICLRARSSPR